MDTQLRLLAGEAADAGTEPEWHLDDNTRRIGLRGVALARQALRAAHRSLPDGPDAPDVVSERHHPAA